MRTMFSTAAALALGLIAAVAMGQEGGRDPSPAALQPGAQQPAAQQPPSQGPAPLDASQPAPPPADLSAPTLGADGSQSNLTEPTDVERRLDNRVELQREIDRTDTLNDRQDGILDRTDVGRDAAANRANQSFNDYRENRSGDANQNAGQRTGENNRWRYVRHNNQWWYWTPQSTWLIWSGDRWMAQADFNRMFAEREYQGSYRTGYRGDVNDGYYNDGFDGGSNYRPGRSFYGRGNYERGYYGPGYYGPGYGYGPGYYNRGAATGAGIGGAIGGRGGANVGAAIGGAVNGW